MSYIDIVFDGPPGPEAGRFVEVENADGKSICFGEWVERDDGFWVLRIQESPFESAMIQLLSIRAATEVQDANNISPEDREKAIDIIDEVLQKYWARIK